MKRLIFTLLISYLSQWTLAQETILVENDKDLYYEEYSVLRADKKVKHGHYLKLSKSVFGEYFLESSGSFSQGKKEGPWQEYYPQSNQIKTNGYYKNGAKDSLWIHYYPESQPKKLIQRNTENGASLEVVSANPSVLGSGSYQNGARTGLWEYYDESGFLSQAFDFDRDSLAFVSKGDLNNLDAGFIGGEVLLTQYLNETFDFLDGFLATNNNKISLQSGMITFLFTIDQHGKVNDITKIEDSIKNKKLYERALATTQSLDSKWYPAKANGVSIAVTKTIVFELINETRRSTVHSDQWTMSTMSDKFTARVWVK